MIILTQKDFFRTVPSFNNLTDFNNNGTKWKHICQFLLPFLVNIYRVRYFKTNMERDECNMSVDGCIPDTTLIQTIALQNHYLEPNYQWWLNQVSFRDNNRYKTSVPTNSGANTCTCGSYFWLNCQQPYHGTILPVYKLRINMNHKQNFIQIKSNIFKYITTRIYTDRELYINRM